MNDQIFKNTHLTIVIKYMKICKNSFGNFENGRSSLLRTGIYLVFSSTYLPWILNCYNYDLLRL